MKEIPSNEALQAAIMDAVLAWQQQPHVRCLGCGEIGYSPVWIEWSEYRGWEIHRYSSRLPEGWLLLEETIREEKSGRLVNRILCPECRKERSL